MRRGSNKEAELYAAAKINAGLNTALNLYKRVMRTTVLLAYTGAAQDCHERATDSRAQSLQCPCLICTMSCCAITTCTGIM